MQDGKLATAARFGLGLLLTAGMVGAGLALSGRSARALSYFQPSPASLRLPGLPLLSGCEAKAQRLVVNGHPVRALVGVSKRPLRDVLDHYEAIAKKQLKRGAPYLREDGKRSGSLLWVTPDGVSRAVILSRTADDRGTQFRLVVDETKRELGTASKNDRLPGGLALAALPGFEAPYTVSAQDGSGVALLRGPGDARGVTARLLSELEDRGFAADRQALHIYKGHGELAIPLVHTRGGLRGVLKVTPDKRAARACLSLHPSS